MPLTSVADRLRESMWRSANDKRLRRVVEAMPEDPPEVPARLDVTGDAELAGFLALAGEVAGREVGLDPFPKPPPPCCGGSPSSWRPGRARPSWVRWPPPAGPWRAVTSTC